MSRLIYLLLFLLVLITTAVAKRDYNASVYKVCVNPWEPLVTCKNGEFAGLDIVQFETINKKLGWEQLQQNETPDVNKTGKRYFRYECMALEELERDLEDEDGECHLGSSLSVTTERLKKGFGFSYPTVRGNLAILTTASYTPGNGWGFLRPVTRMVWVTILLTGLVLVPTLLVIFEYVAEQERMPRTMTELSSGMSTALWNSMTTLLQTGGDTIRSAEGKIMMVGYAFLVLIIITVYTANMTSNLTVRKIRATVNSPAELQGSKVGTLPIYAPRLERYGITTIQKIIANEDTMTTAFEALESGEVDALAMAAPWVTAVVKKRGCNGDLFVFNLEVEPYDYALPFPGTIPPDVAKEINRAIMELSEEGRLQEIADSFGAEPNGCIEGYNEDPLFVFGFWQIYGVWVLMGGAIVLAVMVSVARCCFRRYKLSGVSLPRYNRFDPRELEMTAAQASPGDNQGADVTENGNGGGEINHGKVVDEYGKILTDIQKEMKELSRRLEVTQPINHRTEEEPDVPRPPSPAIIPVNSSPI